MKYLQVGILIALVAVAVLLGLNLMNDRTAAEPEAIPSAAATPLPSVDEPEVADAKDEPAGSAATPSANEMKPEPVAVAARTKPEAQPAGPAPKAVTRERSGAPAPAPAARKPSPTPQASTPATKPAREPEVRAENVSVDPPAASPDLRNLPPAPSVTPPATTSETERYELMRPESEKKAAQAAPAPPRTVTIPSGSILTIRTIQTLSSRSNSVGDTFSGTLDQPLVHDDLVIAERGSKVEGRVVEVTESGRVKGVAQLVVQLTKINTSDGQSVPVQTQSFVMEAEKSAKSDATKVGIATGIGAALGAIFGGGKGAAIGAAAGAGAGGGTVLATKGKPAEIPSETRINFRLDQPLTITEKINN